MLEKTANNNYSQYLKNPIFKIISDIVTVNKQETYVIGGYVRDILLKRNSKDIDIVTVGSGIDIASKVSEKLGKDFTCAVYKNFGTALIKGRDLEIEFVGARKESYRKSSRNPIVENGTMEDDFKRRDFTINTFAISLLEDNFGELCDYFNAIKDLENKIIQTPLNPNTTFDDDPLRMLRAVRFATQLNFNIEQKTYNAIVKNAKRLKIISPERIHDEFAKILMSKKPSYGIELLFNSGLLQEFLPEISSLYGVEKQRGLSHKDNFYHTIEVVDKVAKNSDNLWLRWAALLHDIGKPVTKRFDKKLGWTFHGHDYIGAKMVADVFSRLKLPKNEKFKYVKKLVQLHLRPISLIEDTVSDSAVRRLLFDAGDTIDDLMILCKADITSKNEKKVKKHLANFKHVQEKLKEVEEKDKVRNFQPPISGELIMEIFDIKPCKHIGVIKNRIKEAILDGEIKNDYHEAYNKMMKIAQEIGLTPKNSN